MADGSSPDINPQSEPTPKAPFPVTEKLALNPDPSTKIDRDAIAPGKQILLRYFSGKADSKERRVSQFYIGKVKEIVKGAPDSLATGTVPLSQASWDHIVGNVQFTNYVFEENSGWLVMGRFGNNDVMKSTEIEPLAAVIREDGNDEDLDVHEVSGEELAKIKAELTPSARSRFEFEDSDPAWRH